MDKNNKVHTLISNLEQEILWIKELNELLAEEKVILTNSQFDDLEKLADKKQNLSNKLENSTKERMTLLGDPDMQAPKNSLHEFFKGCSSNEVSQITELNNQLAEQLVKCRELNTINGQVIATNIHTRQEIVNVLTGNKVKSASVYTATGDIKSPGPGDSSHHQKA